MVFPYSPSFPFQKKKKIYSTFIPMKLKLLNLGRNNIFMILGHPNHDYGIFYPLFKSILCPSRELYNILNKNPTYLCQIFFSLGIIMI